MLEHNTVPEGEPLDTQTDTAPADGCHALRLVILLNVSLWQFLQSPVFDKSILSAGFSSASASSESSWRRSSGWSRRGSSAGEAFNARPRSSINDFSQSKSSGLARHGGLAGEASLFRVEAPTLAILGNLDQATSQVATCSGTTL